MSAPLPKGWTLATLSDLISSGGLFTDGDWVESKDQDPAGKVRLIQLADVGDGAFRNRSSRFLRPDQAERLGCTFLQEGDVLVARMPDPLGRACIYPGSKLPAVTAVDVCIIRPSNDEIDNRWLMWFLNAPQFRREVSARQTGTTRKRISRSNLAALPLPVPTFAEQNHIVAAIEELLSRLDAAEVALWSAEHRIGALEKSIITEASSTLTPPQHWKITTVADAGTVGLGLQRSPKRHNGPNMRPYLRVANVFEDRIDDSDVMSMDIADAEWERYLLQDGDVLLNEGQSPEFLGRPAIYRGEPANVAFTNSVIRFRANAGIDPEWALLVFRSHLHNRRFMRESQITTNIAHLSAGRFKTVEFPVPPLDEQHARVADARFRLDGCARLRAEVAAGRRRSTVLRRSVLSAAFSGKLIPQDQD